MRLTPEERLDFFVDDAFFVFLLVVVVVVVVAVAADFREEVFLAEVDLRLDRADFREEVFLEVLDLVARDDLILLGVCFLVAIIAAVLPLRGIILYIFWSTRKS